MISMTLQKRIVKKLVWLISCTEQVVDRDLHLFNNELKSFKVRGAAEAAHLISQVEVTLHTMFLNKVQRDITDLSLDITKDSRTF